VPEAKVIQNRPFIRVGHYGLAEGLHISTLPNCSIFNNLRKIMEKSAFLHENAHYLFDIC